MERELWPLIYHTLRAAARGTHQKWVQYQPWEIAAVLLWAALHDRSVEWACEEQNWSTTRLRPEEIPSASTMSRRPKKLVFAIFLNRVAALLKGDGKPAWELVVDGKPLPVGRCSKDPDAKGGALGRGYKLHAIWGDDPLPEAWEVTAMREYEGAAAVRLLGRVRGVGFLYGRELRGQPALRRGGRERVPVAGPTGPAGQRARALLPERTPADVVAAVRRRVGLAVVPVAEFHRAEVRQRGIVRRRAGSAAQPGPASGACRALGVVQARHQRRTHPPPTTEPVIVAIS
jgi:hypothetical protein